jgi:hypothetical protein
MQYHFKDGSVYIGHFLAGFRSGQGRITYSDGSTFDGQWRDNEKHGKHHARFLVTKSNRFLLNSAVVTAGTFRSKDGSVFKGTFRNDNDYYDGVVTSPNGHMEKIVKGKRRNA